VLKKTIRYEDFNGKETTEDFYFHLSKAELVEMEISHQGGMHDHLQQIVASEDGKAIMAEFKELILSAYGKRSEDGKRFIKNQALRDEFASTEAYSQLFFELCTQAEKAAEFVNGIVPAGLGEEVAKMIAAENPSDDFENNSRPGVPAPRILSQSEVQEMDSDELKSGLATGRYMLAPS
jgi:hypothetical protein